MAFANSMSAMLGVLGTGDPKPGVCSNCKNREPVNASGEEKLKRCARCRSTMYCSRSCQRSDWKKGHKTKCTFDALGNNCYLDSLPETDAMDQLIDAYRLRVEDDYKFRHDNRGLYAGEDPLNDFKEFLDMAEKQKATNSGQGAKKPSILPDWWNEEKRRLCIRRALAGSNWCDISRAVEKSDIIEHYKDSMMPMKLRMMAERVYGHNVMDHAPPR